MTDKDEKLDHKDDIAKENEDEEVIVVTARCSDIAPHFEDIDQIPCSKCGEMTWLSNSWRGKRIDKIICEPCFENEKYEDNDYSFRVTEKCLDDAIEVIHSHYDKKGSYDSIRKKIIDKMERRLGRQIIVD